MTKRLKTFSVREVEQEYAPDDTIWRTDDDRIHRIKKIVQSLPEIDRRIILLYTDTASQREVAKALGVSVATTNSLIKDIRQKIVSQL